MLTCNSRRRHGNQKTASRAATSFRKGRIDAHRRSRSRRSRALKLEPLEKRELLDATGFVEPPSHDFLLSTSESGSVTNSDGSVVEFDDSDVLLLQIRHDHSYQYSMYFDGSDVGLTESSEDIDALALLPGGDLVVSTTGHFATGEPGKWELQGRGEDLFRFSPASLGETTAGTWSQFFDGSDVGLDNRHGNIDAVEATTSGAFIVSFGPDGVPDLGAEDHDLLAFFPTTLGEATAGTWQMVLDGSDVGLTESSEGIDAVAADGYFSTRGNFAVQGLTGGNEDVIRFEALAPGDDTVAFGPRLRVDGSRYGLADHNIDALAIVDLVIVDEHGEREPEDQPGGPAFMADVGPGPNGPGPAGGDPGPNGQGGSWRVAITPAPVDEPSPADAVTDVIEQDPALLHANDPCCIPIYRAEDIFPDNPDLAQQFRENEQQLRAWLEAFEQAQGQPVPQPLPESYEPIRQQMGDDAFAEWLKYNEFEKGNFQGLCLIKNQNAQPPGNGGPQGGVAGNGQPAAGAQNATTFTEEDVRELNRKRQAWIREMGTPSVRGHEKSYDDLDHAIRTAETRLREARDRAEQLEAAGNDPNTTKAQYKEAWLKAAKALDAYTHAHQRAMLIKSQFVRDQWWVSGSDRDLMDRVTELPVTVTGMNIRPTTEQLNGLYFAANQARKAVAEDRDSVAFTEGVVRGVRNTAIVGGGTLFVFIAAPVVLPAATPYLTATGLSLLVYAGGSTTANRLAEGQTIAEAGVGTLTDLTGINGVYMGVYGRDLVTQQEVRLTAEQRGNLAGAGAMQVIMLGGTLLATPTNAQNGSGSGRNGIRAPRPKDYPVAARDRAALEAHYGEESVQALGRRSDKNVLVVTKDGETQVWVRPDLRQGATTLRQKYGGYKAAYEEALNTKVPKGYDVDHVQSQARAGQQQYGYVRLELVKSEVNQAWGRFMEARTVKAGKAGHVEPTGTPDVRPIDQFQWWKIQGISPEDVARFVERFFQPKSR